MTASALPQSLDLSDEAAVEAVRIEKLRRGGGIRRGRVHRHGSIFESVVVRKRSALPPGVVHVYELRLTGPGGAIVHSELAVIVGGSADATRLLSRIRALAQSGQAVLRARELAIVRPQMSASRALVQAGLFDRRALRLAADRQRSANALIEESARRRDDLSDERLTSTAALRAILRVVS